MDLDRPPVTHPGAPPGTTAANVVLRREIVTLRLSPERVPENGLAAQGQPGDDPDLFTQRDDRVHHGRAEAAGLSSVWDVIEREKAQFDRLRCLGLPASTPVDLLIRQHRTILAATLSRNPAAAELAATHRELFAFQT